MKIAVETEVSEQLKQTLIKARVSVQVARLLESADKQMKEAYDIMRQYHLITEEEYDMLTDTPPSSPAPAEHIEQTWLEEIKKQMCEELEDALKVLREDATQLDVDFLSADQYQWTNE